MNAPTSCERDAPAVPAPAGSRILRFQPGFRWEGVPVAEYKAPADHWCGIIRLSLVGEQGERTAFHLRYFEIQPGGYSSREHHRHEHVVYVLHGRGKVRLGDRLESIGPGDIVYVAPDELHQFSNDGTEPLGFLCIVDAVRDQPTPAK